MAYLLRAWKKNTIKTQMYRYLCIVIGAALLTNIATLIFYGINSSQYEMVMNHVLDLNQFYVTLEKGNRALGNYIQEGNETDYQNILENMDASEAFLTKLETPYASQLFLRDIQDMREMLNSYREKAEQIDEMIRKGSGETFTSGMLVEVRKQYDNAQNVYNLMDSEFKNLHLTLLKYTNQKMAVLIQQKKIYYVEFLIVIIMLTGWSIRRGRRLAEQIAEPIQTLTEAAVEIRDGKISEFTEIRTSEVPEQEIQILINVFNMMIDQIRQQFQITEENARTKVMLHKQELENLKIANQLRTSELKVLQM